MFCIKTWAFCCRHCRCPFCTSTAGLSLHVESNFVRLQSVIWSRLHNYCSCIHDVCAMPSNVLEVGHFRVIVLLKLEDPEGFFSIHFSLKVQANAQLI